MPRGTPTPYTRPEFYDAHGRVRRIPRGAFGFSYEGRIDYHEHRLLRHIQALRDLRERMSPRGKLARRLEDLQAREQNLREEIASVTKILADLRKGSEGGPRPTSTVGEKEEN